MIIFLGAGASKPFGIPTMVEFVEEFEKELVNWDSEYHGEESEINLYNYIKKFLGDEGDLEAVLSILNLLSEKVDLKRLGLRGIYYADYFIRRNHILLEYDLQERNIDPILNAKTLTIKIKKFIKEKCKPKNNDDVFDVYNKFFEIIMPVGNTFDIFTTNYDLCVEIFCKQKGEMINRGIKPDESRGLSVLRGNPDKNKSMYPLSKLHGSIDWYKIGGDICERESTDHETGDHTKYDQVIEGEMMIYPVQEKYIYRDPFFDMFHYLKEKLFNNGGAKTRCIVVGYSFRDDAITNIFIDAVKRNPNLKIILLDPEANEIIEKNLKQIRDNIVPIEENFGGDKALNELLKKLKPGWQRI